MNNDALNEIVDRLEHLERENRRIRSVFKAAVCLLVLALGAGLCLGCQTRSDRIAAREIVLTDPQGHVRAKLSVSKGQGSNEFSPSLDFFDASGDSTTKVSESGLYSRYKGSHATFDFTGISFDGDHDTHFLLSDTLLTYGRGQSMPHTDGGISITSGVNGSEFGVNANKGDVSMYVASRGGGELDITADRAGARIDRIPASRRN